MRAQLQWLLLGFVACILVLVPAVILPASVPIGQYLLAIAFAMIPLAVAIAVVRHGLFDVELIVNRAVVYLALTALGRRSGRCPAHSGIARRPATGCPATACARSMA